MPKIMIVGGKFHLKWAIPDLERDVLRAKVKIGQDGEDDKYYYDDSGKGTKVSGQHELKRIINQDGRFKMIKLDILPICAYNWEDEDDLFSFLEAMGVFLGGRCTGRLYALDDSKNHVEIYFAPSSGIPKMKSCPWEWRLVYERKTK